jgi:hypothetical protein
MAMASELREPAIIEISSGDPAIPNQKLTGTIHARLNKTLTVVTDEQIVASAAVRVHSKDMLSLGEVLRCVAESDAKWTVHVGVERNMLII